MCEGQTHRELSIDMKAEDLRRPQASHLEEPGGAQRSPEQCFTSVRVRVWGAVCA